MIKLNDHYQQKREIAESGRRAVSATGASPRLENDLLSGLRRAVSNAQTRLALEYVFEIIDAQAAQIVELQNRLDISTPIPAEELEEDRPEERKKPATKKPTTDASAEKNV